ncbi:MAG TPA: WXG100 family type VII secretion target [Ornithinibacter sp.]|nr:WXG100 family type VII secretion target [Ornithinibacter sp.]HQD67794.1 WXG100 family type VII secretion target [Ornithinibacter sp.]
MANMNVTYADMQTEATSLRNGQQEITNQLNALRNRINNLVTNGFVTDSASGAFQHMYENFNNGATQTISALDQIAGTLESMAKTLQETDQQLASSIGN